MATTGTDRSNSYTMPRELRWGNQRFLRCIKVNSDAQISPLRRVADNHSDQNNCALQSRTARDGKRERETYIDSCCDFPHRSRKVCSAEDNSGFDDGIAATREKVMLDLQTAADRMKHAIFNDGLVEGEVYKHPPPEAAAAVTSVESELSRARNLRTRRADLKTSSNIDAGGGKGPMVNSAKPNSGVCQMKAAEDEKSMMRLRSGGGAATKMERPKFSVALSKQEIEEDFYSMVGRRPPRRPKKRNRNVQRNLDTLFPGLYLSEVTPNMY